MVRCHHHRTQMMFILHVNWGQRACASGQESNDLFKRLNKVFTPEKHCIPSRAYCVSALGPSLYAMVVSRPWLEGTGGLGPVLRRMKAPVPYVFFASPGLQRWPNIADCWSPRQPAMGTPARGPLFTYLQVNPGPTVKKERAQIHDVGLIAPLNGQVANDVGH